MLLALASVSVAGMAQETTEKYSVATNSFWSNWFIQANVAGTAFYSSQENNLNLSNSPLKGFRNNLGASVAIGKWFTPGLGLRTKVNGVWGRTVNGDDKKANASKYWQANEQVLFNLSNMLCGYNPDRVWNFIPYAGAGIGRNMTYNSYAMGLQAGKSLLLAVVVAVVGRYAIKFINKFVAGMLERRNVEPTVQSFLKSFVNILLVTLLIITVVGTLGVNTTSLAALLASAGLAVGMALSGNLQNLAGGLILLFFKPFKVGDFIEAQGVSGIVKAIQTFHTVLTTTDNKELFIPNGPLSSGNVTNYTKNALRRVDFTVSVEYGTDVQKVKEVTLELLKADERIMQEPAPFIALKELASSSVDFTVRVWTKATDYWDVFFETNERIYAEFNKQGIKFPFPQLQIHQ